LKNIFIEENKQNVSEKIKEENNIELKY